LFLSLSLLSLSSFSLLFSCAVVAFAAAVVYAICCLRPRSRAGCVEEAEQEEEVCLGDGLFAISNWRAASCCCLLCILFEFFFISFWFLVGEEGSKQRRRRWGEREEERREEKGREEKAKWKGKKR
jgi:hypothetical protein